MVSDNFFTGLGVRARLGRVFGAEEAGAGAAPVAVIGYEWWKKQYGLDPACWARRLRSTATPSPSSACCRASSGVCIRATGQSFYVPLSAQPQLMADWPPTSPAHWWIKLLARVRLGVKPEQLQTALNVVFAAKPRQP